MVNSLGISSSFLIKKLMNIALRVVRWWYSAYQCVFFAGSYCDAYVACSNTKLTYNHWLSCIYFEFDSLNTFRFSVFGTRAEPWTWISSSSDDILPGSCTGLCYYVPSNYTQQRLDDNNDKNNKIETFCGICEAFQSTCTLHRHCWFCLTSAGL